MTVRVQQQPGQTRRRTHLFGRYRLSYLVFGRYRLPYLDRSHRHPNVQLVQVCSRKCHAGCELDDILAAAQLEHADQDAGRRRDQSSPGRPPGNYGESTGKPRLYVKRQRRRRRTDEDQPRKFTLSGDGLCIGRDSGDNVSQEYKSPGKFLGGTILGVEVSVGKDVYLDLEKAAAAAVTASGMMVSAPASALPKTHRRRQRARKE